MGLFDKLKKKKFGSHENPYEGLRNLALNLKPNDVQVTLTNNEQVYVAVVDIPAESGIATLVCAIDGSVSLYFSSGGGAIGIGQRYEKVREAGASFLVSAGQTIPLLSKASDFNLPQNNKASIYLLVRDGAYKAEFDMNNPQQSDQHIQFLNFLVQNTLTEIRESGALD